MERDVELCLEARHLTGRLARKALLHREVEEDRQVRLQAVRGGVLQGSQEI